MAKCKWGCRAVTRLDSALFALYSPAAALHHSKYYLLSKHMKVAWCSSLRLSFRLPIIWCNVYFTQDDATDPGAHGQALVFANGLFNCQHCANSKPSVCKSVSHNRKTYTHGQAKTEGSIPLFDFWDTQWVNKLMCNLAEQVTCIYCRGFDLL